MGEQLAGLTLECAEPLGDVVHQIEVGPEPVAGQPRIDFREAVEREEHIRRLIAALLEFHEPGESLLGDRDGSFVIRLRGPLQDAKFASVGHSKGAGSLGGNTDGASLEVDVLPEQIEKLALSEPGAYSKLYECPQPQTGGDIEHRAYFLRRKHSFRSCLCLGHADLCKGVLLKEPVPDRSVEHRFESAKRLGKRCRCTASFLDHVPFEQADRGLIDLRQENVLAERSRRVLACMPHALEAVGLHVECDRVHVVLDESAEGDLARLVSCDLASVDLRFLLASTGFRCVAGHLPN